MTDTKFTVEEMRAAVEEAKDRGKWVAATLWLLKVSRMRLLLVFGLLNTVVIWMMSVMV